MAISVTRAFELIVDWTHEEIVALEAHLGMHPNRKPVVEILPAADTVAGRPKASSAGTAQDQLDQLEKALAVANARIAKLEADNLAMVASVSPQQASIHDAVYFRDIPITTEAGLDLGSAHAQGVEPPTPADETAAGTGPLRIQDSDLQAQPEAVTTGPSDAHTAAENTTRAAPTDTDAPGAHTDEPQGAANGQA